MTCANYKSTYVYMMLDKSLAPIGLTIQVLGLRV